MFTSYKQAPNAHCAYPLCVLQIGILNLAVFQDRWHQSVWRRDIHQCVRGYQCKFVNKRIWKFWGEGGLQHVSLGSSSHSIKNGLPQNEILGYCKLLRELRPHAPFPMPISCYLIPFLVYSPDCPLEYFSESQGLLLLQIYTKPQ